MKFSIIVIFYSGRKITMDCIDSILKTDFDDYEVILVDNGSNDGSFEYFCKKYINDNKISVVRMKKNDYVTGGYNFGVKKTKGDRLIFMNNDLEVDPKWLKELSKKTQEKPNDIFQPRIMYFYNKKLINCMGGRYIFPGLGISIGRGKKYISKDVDELLIDYCSSICFMINKKLFKKLGGFDKSFKFYYEDVDINLRAKKYGIKAWCCVKSVVYHKESITVKKKERKSTLTFYARKNQLKTVEKNFDGLEKYFRLFSFWVIKVLLKARGLFFD